MFDRSGVREKWERWLTAGKLFVGSADDEFFPFLTDAV